MVQKKTNTNTTPKPMEKKQTAVEWLIEQIENNPDIELYAESLLIKNQALQMEKEHSREALHAAFKAGWMRANATNYNESYFNHYYDNL